VQQYDLLLEYGRLGISSTKLEEVIMYCSHCGTVVEENVRFCPNCGNPPQHQNIQQQNLQQPYMLPTYITPPPDYLIWSILSLVFCCVPLGIVALIYSIQCKSAIAAGRYNDAVKHSKTAFQWNLVSLIAGILIGILYVGIAVIGVISENGGNF
jgi:predicted RNA-binding Zn-ribbon protein involved in translation (DUF1610 family)